MNFNSWQIASDIARRARKPFWSASFSFIFVRKIGEYRPFRRRFLTTSVSDEPPEQSTFSLLPQSIWTSADSLLDHVATGTTWCLRYARARQQFQLFYSNVYLVEYKLTWPKLFREQEFPPRLTTRVIDAMPRSQAALTKNLYSEDGNKSACWNLAVSIGSSSICGENEEPGCWGVRG